METTYTMEYKFETPSSDTYKGKILSSFPFNQEENDNIKILYLPSDPKVNDLPSRVELTLGNIIFWTIAFVFWLIFFPGIGIFLFFAGFPKKGSNKKQMLNKNLF